MYIVLEITEVNKDTYMFSSKVDVTIEAFGAYNTKEEADEVVAMDPKRRITLKEFEAVTLSYGHAE